MTAPSLVAPAASAARSSIAIAASFLISALLGGLLALLIAIIVGENADTDSFLAAYSVYLVFTLFGSTLRIALVPMMGPAQDEPALRLAATDALRRLMGAGAILATAMLMLAPLIGQALTSGGGSASTATISLMILAAASFCQIAAASLSATLAAARRFAASAALFVLGSTATLLLATALMAAIGILGAPLGILGGSVVLYSAHHVYLGRFGFTVFPSLRATLSRATWRLAATAAAGAAVPLTLQLNLTIALSAVAGTVGVVTAYSYAYFLAVLLSAVTASTIGFVTMPDLVAALAERGRSAAEGYFEETSPIAVFLYVPLAAALATFGRPVLDATLGSALSPATIDLLWDITRIFLIMCLAWAILAPLTTLALSLRMSRALTILAVSMLTLQVAVVIPLAQIGATSAALGHAIVGVVLVVVVAYMVFGRNAARASARALVKCAPAGPLALVFPAISWAGPADPSWLVAAVLAAIGVAGYFAVATFAWPSVGGRTMHMLLGARPAATRRG